MEGEVAYDDAACVIATNSFYSSSGDDPFRRSLFLKMVADLSAANRQFLGGFPLVVTDTSPEHRQLAADVAERNPDAVVLDGRNSPGIGPQTITSIAYAHAHGAPFVLRIDPEKYGLVDSSILALLLDYLAGSSEDIVCVGRSPKVGFASLPPYQQITERVMSRALASLGLPEDTASGIRLMNRHGMELFVQFDYAQHGSQWECLWYVLLDALRQGAKVGELFLPFVHPREMLLMETGQFEESDEDAAAKLALYNNKRDDQAALIIPKVVAYAASLGIYPTWDPTRTWTI